MTCHKCKYWNTDENIVDKCGHRYGRCTFDGVESKGKTTFCDHKCLMGKSLIITFDYGFRNSNMKKDGDE